LLAVAGARSVRVWDCRERAFVTPELTHPAPIESLVFSARGHRLATGCQDGQARIFAVAPDTTKPLFAPVRHERWHREFAGKAAPIPPLFIEEDRKLLTVSGGQLLWSDAETGARARSEPVLVGSVAVVALRGDGQLIAVAGGSHKGAAQFIETASG